MGAGTLVVVHSAGAGRAALHAMAEARRSDPTLRGLPARATTLEVASLADYGVDRWREAFARDGVEELWLLVTDEDDREWRDRVEAQMRALAPELQAQGLGGERLRIVGAGEVARVVARGDAAALRAALGRLDTALQRSPPPAVVASIRMTHASAPLTREIDVRDEFGAARTIAIPAERALTVFVDRRELVTLMTLGAAPELLVLGYLRNQRLVERADDIASITVDWDVAAAAVKTRAGIERFDEKTAKRVVTTGCGQGTVFGDLMAEIDNVRLPPASEPTARVSQATLYGLIEAMRRQESTYKSAGSVHGCALFRGDELLTFVEDVGRHNAIDTIAGWMWLHDVDGADKTFYTTGRLTSEMVMKSAQMGVPIVVSRSGITQMGLEIAERLGLALFGRVSNRHFLCYCGFDRFDAAPEPPPPSARGEGEPPR